jgi:hypothetical protein
LTAFGDKLVSMQKMLRFKKIGAEAATGKGLQDYGF